MSATRQMKDKGEGQIGDMITQEKDLSLEAVAIVLMTFQI